MSIYGAMFSGVSGLNANSQALGMIADNISNVNTVGFKGTTAQFSTLVTQSASRTTFSPGGVSSTPVATLAPAATNTAGTVWTATAFNWRTASTTFP